MNADVTFRVTATFSSLDFTCGAESTLKDVLNKLAICKVHRLFVIDKEKKPTGVISLGDVLR